MLASREKVPSIMAKPVMASRAMPMIWGMPGRFRARSTAWLRLIRAWVLAAGFRVSGSHSSTSMAAVKDSPAATRNGRYQPWVASRRSLPASPERIPAMAGPNTKPRPKAAPIMPSTLERSWGEEESAMAAWATEMLPPVQPPSNREASTQSMLPAVPSTR